jgi:hypothetical protein
MTFRRCDRRKGSSYRGRSRFACVATARAIRSGRCWRRATSRGLLRAGELIYVSACRGAPGGSEADHAEARMALVMVQTDERDGRRSGGSVRAWLLGPTTKVRPSRALQFDETSPCA